MYKKDVQSNDRFVSFPLIIISIISFFIQPASFSFFLFAFSSPISTSLPAGQVSLLVTNLASSFLYHPPTKTNMSSFKAIVALGLMTTAQLVAGHGAIIKAVGNAGGSGSKN